MGSQLVPQNWKLLRCELFLFHDHLLDFRHVSVQNLQILQGQLLCDDDIFYLGVGAFAVIPLQ